MNTSFKLDDAISTEPLAKPKQDRWDQQEIHILSDTLFKLNLIQIWAQEFIFANEYHHSS